jgi:cephalosporin hydroxylase
MQYQSTREFGKLITIAKTIQPYCVIEIGSMFGETLRPLIAVAEHVISVDYLLPEQDSRRIGQLNGREMSSDFAKMMGTRLDIISGDSHDPAIFKRVKECITEAPSILFIDGDHTYNGVKMDFEMYGPLVKEGGIIAFHDIIPNPQFGDIQVPAFWNEIKNNYPYREFCEYDNQWGIGVIVTNEA